MMKLVGKIAVAICVLILMWFFFSWVDIVSDNLDPNPQHSDINVFVLMTKDYEVQEGN